MSPIRSVSRSCNFPPSGRPTVGPTRPLSVRVDLQQVRELQKPFQNEIGNDLLRSYLQVSWAVLLRCYTGLNEVCFGFEEVGGSSHDAANHGQHSVISLELDGEMSIEQLLTQAQSQDTSTESSTPSTHDFNTSILIRHAISTSTTAKSPSPNTQSHSSVKPDEVCS